MEESKQAEIARSTVRKGMRGHFECLTRFAGERGNPCVSLGGGKGGGGTICIRSSCAQEVALKKERGRGDVIYPLEKTEKKALAFIQGTPLIREERRVGGKNKRPFVQWPDSNS